MWAPGETADVSQLNEVVDAVPEVGPKIGVAPPSSCTVHVMVPVPPLSLMPTLTVPVTVVPSPGLVNVALMPVVFRLI